VPLGGIITRSLRHNPYMLHSRLRPALVLVLLSGIGRGPGVMQEAVDNKFPTLGKFDREEEPEPCQMLVGTILVGVGPESNSKAAACVRT
jgi:hypothetical protein